MDRAAAFLDAAYRTPMPRLPHVDARRRAAAGEARAEAAPARRPKDMFRVIRAMPMSALELTEEWFESDAVTRGDRRGRRSTAVTLGPMSAGTGYTLMHNWLNRGGLAPSARRRRHAAASPMRWSLRCKARGGELRYRRRREERCSSRTAARAACDWTNGEEIVAPTRVLGRRPAPHAARSRRRARAAAGVRLAHAVDQDARLGRQGASADRRQPRPAEGHAGRSRRPSAISSAPTTRPSTARCRRSPIWKSRRPAASCRCISSSRPTRCASAIGDRRARCWNAAPSTPRRARFPQLQAVDPRDQVADAARPRERPTA